MKRVPIMVIMRRSPVFHGVCWVRLMVRRCVKSTRYIQALEDGGTLDLGHATRT